MLSRSEYEMNLGQPTVLFHFSPLMRKMKQKESRQNDASTRKARTILAVLPGQRTPKNQDSNINRDSNGKLQKLSIGTCVTECRHGQTGPTVKNHASGVI
ncbi:hypothetical protein ACFLU5_01150 [Bacteroidota bacterium]